MKPFNYEECVKNHNSRAITRDGRTVRLLCNDFKPSGRITSKILALVKNVPGGEAETIVHFELWGTYNPNKASHGLDLFTPPVKIKREYWVNIYDLHLIYNHEIATTGASLHPNKNVADNKAGTSRIACVKVTIECEEGDGLTPPLPGPPAVVPAPSSS